MDSASREITTPSQKPPKKRRLFFALWPDKSIRKEMALLNRKLPSAERGGRLMSDANLHLTLHYIGPVSEEDMTSLNLAAQKVKSAPFKLKLDRV